ncbi:hypothetical protein [Sphingobacterium paucimobilis]|uniref:Carbohydrate-binding domain-containing protein n=1 Tax=Sphingobacterium paucimobilis HER1398 TaxID=1346330 RepID=U2J5G2_9SPHI|nr:hypothetical protein [Sphingobacterium paucimobilis]ERJ57903.1 hypothetical protein M472_03900 [Sphingobacterium paucimobilis HER1398]
MLLNKSEAQISSCWKESVVIDGELAEWKGEEFVYDESTWLWYTMANDENFLYLAVRKNKHAGKIFNWGGLMFTVNRKGKKNRANEPWITFPRAVDGSRKVPEKEWTVLEIDNFEGIKESKLNIYNEYGIQVGWTKFKAEDEKEDTYCYELAIPLSLLKLKAKEMISFNILLRGFREDSPAKRGRAGMYFTFEQFKDVPNTSREEIEMMVRDINDSNDWTDFWDTYRLATKPD